jgi:hypothetical protein
LAVDAYFGILVGRFDDVIARIGDHDQRSQLDRQLVVPNWT